ncbi:hypothetical protein AB7044_00610 [Providencia stuartii]|nr:hypothetical protein [Providencia stuartii]
MDIPSQENAKVTTSTMLNLGFVIHASEILGFSEIVKKITIPNWQPQNGALVKRKNSLHIETAFAIVIMDIKYKHCHGKIK